MASDAIKVMKQQTNPAASALTSDIDAAAWLYARGIPLLSHHNDGRRTSFIFQCQPSEVSKFYGLEGREARGFLQARRTLLGLVHDRAG